MDFKIDNGILTRMPRGKTKFSLVSPGATHLDFGTLLFQTSANQDISNIEVGFDRSTVASLTSSPYNNIVGIVSDIDGIDYDTTSGFGTILGSTGFGIDVSAYADYLEYLQENEPTNTALSAFQLNGTGDGLVIADFRKLQCSISSATGVNDFVNS